MIVADTNLLVYLYIRGVLTQQAEEIVQRDSLWMAPLLWRSEFRNALIGLIRRRHLRLDVAEEIAERAEAFMHGREYAMATQAVLRLAAASSCSAYDCEFVALAQELDIPFVTADRQVLRSFPSIAQNPDSFARS